MPPLQQEGKGQGRGRGRGQAGTGTGSGKSYRDRSRSWNRLRATWLILFGGMLHRRRWEAQLGLPRNLQKYSRLRSSISSMRFLDTASTLRLAFSRGWSNCTMRLTASHNRHRCTDPDHAADGASTVILSRHKTLQPTANHNRRRCHWPRCWGCHNRYSLTAYSHAAYGES